MENLKLKLQNAIDTHSKYSNSFFWSPASSSSERRRKEESFHKENPSFDFLFNEKSYTVSFEYSQSCKNVYYSLNVYEDGVKKDVRILKSILKNL